MTASSLTIPKHSLCGRPFAQVRTAYVCVCGQLTSPFFPPQLTADIVPLHAGYDTWLEGQSILLNTLGVWEKSKKSKGTTVFCECFHSVFLP